MLKTICKSYILPAVILTAGFSFSTQAKSIKELTSKKTSKKVEKDVKDVARMANSGLKVHSVGVGIGQTFLSGDFKDHGEDKITADLFYNYSASHSFDFLANFHYSNHEYRTREVTSTGLALGIKAKMFNFDAFAPFAVGGLGFYAPKMKRVIDGVLVESKSKITFGYHFGAGVDLDLNDRVAVGAIGMVHNPFDVKQDDQADVEGSYYKLLLTAFYKF
jgi:hypothetical protein